MPFPAVLSGMSSSDVLSEPLEPMFLPGGGTVPRAGMRRIPGPNANIMGPLQDSGNSFFFSSSHSHSSSNRSGAQHLRTNNTDNDELLHLLHQRVVELLPQMVSGRPSRAAQNATDHAGTGSSSMSSNSMGNSSSHPFPGETSLDILQARRGSHDAVAGSRYRAGEPGGTTAAAAAGSGAAAHPWQPAAASHRTPSNGDRMLEAARLEAARLQTVQVNWLVLLAMVAMLIASFAVPCTCQCLALQPCCLYNTAS